MALQIGQLLLKRNTVQGAVTVPADGVFDVFVAAGRSCTPLTVGDFAMAVICVRETTERKLMEFVESDTPDRRVRNNV